MPTYNLGGVEYTIGVNLPSSAEANVRKLATAMQKLQASVAGLPALFQQLNQAGAANIDSFVKMFDNLGRISTQGFSRTISQSAQQINKDAERAMLNMEKLKTQEARTNEISQRAAEASAKRQADIQARQAKAANDAVVQQQRIKKATQETNDSAIVGFQRIIAAFNKANEAVSRSQIAGAKALVEPTVQANRAAKSASESRKMNAQALIAQAEAQYAPQYQYARTSSKSSEAAIKQSQAAIAPQLAANNLAISYQNVVTAQNKAAISAVHLQQAQQSLATGMQQGVLLAVQSLSFALEALGLDFITSKFEELAKESTLLAGRVENLGTIVNVIGQNVGYSTVEISAYTSQIEKLNITTQAARQSLALFARNEMDLAKASKLARVAQDSAVISGQNSSETFEKMALAIQRLDTRMMRNAGIMVNLRNVYQQHALATGRVETTLTEREKQELYLNAVLRKGVDVYGAYEAAMGDVYKQWTSMDRLIEQSQKKFGEGFLPAFRTFVSVSSDALKSFLEWGPATTSLANGAVAATITLGKLGQWLLWTASAAGQLAFNFVMCSQALSTISAAGGITAKVLNGIVAVAISPWALAAAAAIAVVTGALAGLAAYQEHVRIEWEKFRDATLEAAVEFLNLRSASRELARLTELADGTAQSQAALDVAFKGVISSAGLYSKQLIDLYNRTRDYKQVVSALNAISPDMQKTNAEMMDKYRKDEEDALKRLQDVRKRIKTAPVGFGPGGAYAPNIGELQKEEKQAQLALDVAKKAADTMTAQRQRELQRMLDMQETAFQLAQRAESQMQKNREKLYSDSNLSILGDMDEFTKKLHSYSVTGEQIIESSVITLQRKLRELREKHDKAMAAEMEKGDVKEQERLKREYDEKRLNLETEQAQTVQQQLFQQAKILYVKNEQYKTSMKLLEIEKERVDKLWEQLNVFSKVRPSASGINFMRDNPQSMAYTAAREFMLAQEQFDTAVVKAKHELDEIEKSTTRAVEEYKRQFYGDREKADRLQLEANATQQSINVWLEKRKDAEKRLAAWRDKGLNDAGKKAEFDKANARLTNAFNALVSAKVDPKSSQDTIKRLQKEFVDSTAAVMEIESSIYKDNDQARQRLQALRDELDQIQASAVTASGVVAGKLQEADTIAKGAIASLKQEQELLEKMAQNAETPEEKEKYERKKKEVETAINAIEAKIIGLENTLRNAAAKSLQIINDEIRQFEQGIDSAIQKQRQLSDHIKQLGGDNRATTADRARESLRTRFQEFQDVNSFIRGERLNVADRFAPGISKGAGVYQQFAEQVVKASTKDQLTALQGLGAGRFAEIRQEMAKQIQDARQEFLKAGNTQERMAAAQKVFTLSQQQANLIPKLAEFEAALNKLIEDRTGQLGKVKAEREEEVDLVKQTIESERQQIINLDEIIRRHTVLLDQLRQEKAIQEEKTAMDLVDAKQRKLDMAEAKERANPSEDNIRATDAARLELLNALKLRTAAQARVAQGAVPAGAVPAGAVPAGAVPAGAVPAGAVPAVGQPAKASPDEISDIKKKVADALASRADSLFADANRGAESQEKLRAWFNSATLRDEFKFGRISIAEVAKQFPGIFQAAGIPNPKPLDRPAGAGRDILADMNRPMPTFDRNGNVPINEFKQQVLGWAGSAPVFARRGNRMQLFGQDMRGGGTAGWLQRTQEAQNAWYGSAWNNAGSFAERVQIMREARRMGRDTEMQRRASQFQEDAWTRQQRFKHFGKEGMWNPFNVLPQQQQLPGVQNLLDKPMNQTQKAAAEMGNALGQVKDALSAMGAAMAATTGVAKATATVAADQRKQSAEWIADAQEAARIIGIG